MHVMCIYVICVHSYYCLSKTGTHHAMHSFHIVISNVSAGSANVIVTARMKMRGNVRGVVNGGTEMA